MNVTKIGPDLRLPWLSRARDLSCDLALFLVNHKYVFQKFFHLIDKFKFSNPTNTTVCPRSSTQGTFLRIETSLRNVPRLQAMSVFDTRKNFWWLIKNKTQTAVIKIVNRCFCFIFIKRRWPKNKSLYHAVSGVSLAQPAVAKLKKLTGKRVVTPGNRCSCQELVETDTAEDRCRLFFSASCIRACTLGRFHGHLYPQNHPRRFFCVKVYKGKELRWREMIRIYIFFPPPSVSHSPSLSFFYSTLFFFFSRPSPLRFANPVACCCELLGVVAQNLKPVKLLATCKRTQHRLSNVASVCT